MPLWYDTAIANENTHKQRREVVKQKENSVSAKRVDKGPSSNRFCTLTNEQCVRKRRDDCQCPKLARAPTYRGSLPLIGHAPLNAGARMAVARYPPRHALTSTHAWVA